MADPLTPPARVYEIGEEAKKKKPLHPVTGYYMRVMQMAARRGRLKRMKLAVDPAKGRSTTVVLPDDVQLPELPQE